MTTESWNAAAHRLLMELVDIGPCRFDHHGGCQEHGYLSLQPGEKCPNAEARELIAAYSEPNSDDFEYGHECEGSVT